MCKVLSHASQSPHSPSFLVLFIKRTFWNSYFKILVKPHYEGNDDQFAKYCQTPRNHRFQEECCCWSLEGHFGAISLKFQPNPILTQNMTNLQNIVTGLLFTVFRQSVCANHVSNILKSLLWNFFLTKLRLIRWPVWKIMSHASESSFSATPIVLTIRTTLWNSHREIVN